VEAEKEEAAEEVAAEEEEEEGVEAMEEEDEEEAVEAEEDAQPWAHSACCRLGWGPSSCRPPWLRRRRRRARRGRAWQDLRATS